MKRATTERLTYDIAEVAQLLGIGRNQAYEAVKTGQIPCIEIGARKLVSKAWLDQKLGITSASIC